MKGKIYFVFYILLFVANIGLISCDKDDEKDVYDDEMYDDDEYSSKIPEKKPSIEFWTITSGGGEINIYFKVPICEPEPTVKLEYGTSANDLKQTKVCQMHVGPLKEYYYYRTYIYSSSGSRIYFRGVATNKYGSAHTGVECRNPR